VIRHIAWLRVQMVLEFFAAIRLPLGSPWEQRVPGPDQGGPDFGKVQLHLKCTVRPRVEAYSRGSVI
jgi:hypothetical protein